MANYQEGDYVPGRGILMPDGTYRATKPGDMGDTTGDAVYGITSDGNGDKPDPKVNSQDLWASAAKTGVTSEVFSKLNSTQQATIAALGDSVGLLYSSGSTGVTLDEALQTAAKDPNISAKYSDALNIDTAQFSEGLKSIQTAVSTESSNNRIQFEKDRKALAEANAAAGTAYSGFREKAQKNLETTESGIVTSSRSSALAQLNQLKQGFSSKWGTAATPDASISFENPLNTSSTSASGLKSALTPSNENVSADPLGTLTGSQPIQKQQDIITKGKDLYDAGQLPTL